MRLTSDPADEREPVWSPDGQTIAYISKAGTEEELRLVTTSGGSSTVLTKEGI